MAVPRRRKPTPTEPTFTPIWAPFALLAAVFLLKAVVLVQLKDHPLLSADAGLDTTAYVQLARRVLGGDLGLGPGLYYVSPLYIYFLAALLGAFRSFTAVRLVQIALGTAAVGFIFLTARRWYGERAAWIAAVLAALTGLFTFYEVLILQSSLDGFFTAAALWCLAAGIPPKGGSHGKAGTNTAVASAGTNTAVVSAFRRNLWILAAGVLWGIQTLNRPNVMLAALGVAVVMAIVLRRMKPAALLTAGLLIGMAPVAIRNVFVAHEWTLLSSHGGLNFYIGNHADATGFYRQIPGVRPAIVGQELDTRRVAEKALGHPVTDAEASSYFYALASSWIREHPGDAAVFFLKKLAFTFHASHVPLPHSYAFFAYDTPGILRYLFVGPWVLVPLGVVGALLRAFGSPPSRLRRFSGTGETPDRAYLAWFAFVPAYAAAVAVFFVADRYRLPLMVPLCVCAGGAFDWAIGTIAAPQVKRLAVPGLVFVGLLAAVNYPVALDEGRWTEGLRTAERLVITERYEDADRWATWLETHHPPQPGAGHLGIARQLMALGKYDRALPYLQRAEAADPNEPRAQYALGQTLLNLDRAPEAVPHLRRGFDAGIELPGGGVDYPRALVATGDMSAAAAALQRIHPAEAAEADAWSQLGRLAMEAKAPAIAEPFFQRAAAMQPSDPATRQQYGLSLLVLNRFDEAARELGEAARLDPRNADTLSRLAYVELRLGRPEEARRHVAAALAVNPDDPLARQLAAVLR